MLCRADEAPEDTGRPSAAEHEVAWPDTPDLGVMFIASRGAPLSATFWTGSPAYGVAGAALGMGFRVSAGGNSPRQSAGGVGAAQVARRQVHAESQGPRATCVSEARASLGPLP